MNHLCFHTETVDPAGQMPHSLEEASAPPAVQVPGGPALFCMSHLALRVPHALWCSQTVRVLTSTIPGAYITVFAGDGSPSLLEKLPLL